MPYLQKISALLCIMTMTSPLFANTQTGGGYIIHGQVNPVHGVVSGGGYTSESGSSSLNSITSGGGYTLVGGAYRSQRSANYLVTETGGGTLVIENMITDSVSVVLESAPLSDVVIAATSGIPASLGVTPATLTFTPANWNIPQIVTVIGLTDANTISEITHITLSVVDANSDDMFDTLPDTIIPVTILDFTTPAPPTGGAGGSSGSSFWFPVQTMTDKSKTICSQNDVGQWYRYCASSEKLSGFPAFAQNAACEGFIQKRSEDIQYEYTKSAPRKEVAAVALAMVRRGGKNVPLISQKSYRFNYMDIGFIGQSVWIQPMIESALHYGVITAHRSYFEPERSVTRAEAFSMVMAAVCLYPKDTVSGTWQESMYTTAKNAQITVRTWDAFESEKPILRQELFVIASRAADWAEKTGGCEPKPTTCQQ